ncbi:MAG: hypothetical protein Q9173_002924 [Seirophora scorigena]
MVKVVERALRLLSQLPDAAPDILDALPFDTASLQHYEVQASQSEGTRDLASERPWKRLKVTHHTNDLVLRSALLIALWEITLPSGHQGSLLLGHNIIDSIIVMLKVVFETSAEETPQDPRWLILESFVGVRGGARAVDIACSDNRTLRYRQVAEDTLTISHVWSHGQGGRPDNAGPEGTGFNVCLHRRYADLAIALGCESYWMDTPCIPSEKELRWECISQITSVFATSAKTLVCDRDIMTIDITDPTMTAYESILAALLVCDWGVRAWTLLEAMRGRSGLYLLCLHNRVISLRELLKSVHAGGRIDLVTFFLGRDYLVPPMAIANTELFGEIITSEIEQEIEDGFVSMGEAAALLSHRHATRDGDDLLIWSLLIGDLEDESPVEMWKRQVGKRIPTGSLISSAQRVQDHPGLSWAPYRPTALQATSNNSQVYPAYDGSETGQGLITEEGLRAKWLVHHLPDRASFMPPGRKDMQVSGPASPYAEIADWYLDGFRWGALLQAMPRRGPRNIPSRYRGALGHVVVVCGSHDGASWEWKGIYEWSAEIPLPSFAIEEILIV